MTWKKIMNDIPIFARYAWSLEENGIDKSRSWWISMHIGVSVNGRNNLLSYDYCKKSSNCTDFRYNIISLYWITIEMLSSGILIGVMFCVYFLPIGSNVQCFVLHSVASVTLKKNSILQLHFSQYFHILMTVSCYLKPYSDNVMMSNNGNIIIGILLVL